MGSPRFIGHTGELKTLSGLPAKTLFVFDANTVLQLLQHADKGLALDDAHLVLLRETRRRVHLHWHQRRRSIPVDAFLAVMELTRQDLASDYASFEARYLQFVGSVYGIKNLDPAWTRYTYHPLERLVATVHKSIGETLKVVIAAVPPSGALSPREVLQRVDGFLAWTIRERDELEMIGGPLLQLAVYAIAGSPEAHRFLKLGKVAKDGVEAVSRNVAWDLMHWINLDLQFHYAKYPATVVCTSDQALAELLLTRRNRGPRTAMAALRNGEARAVESHGDMDLPKLARLDDSALGDEVTKRLLNFWKEMGTLRESEIYFGPMGQPAA